MPQSNCKGKEISTHYKTTCETLNRGWLLELCPAVPNGSDRLQNIFKKCFEIILGLGSNSASFQGVKNEMKPCSVGCSSLGVCGVYVTMPERHTCNRSKQTVFIVTTIANKNHRGRRERLRFLHSAYLLVLVLCLSAARHPRWGDIAGDDRDLVQWHVHPSRAKPGTLTHALPVPLPEQRAWWSQRRLRSLQDDTEGRQRLAFNKRHKNKVVKPYSEGRRSLSVEAKNENAACLVLFFCKMHISAVYYTTGVVSVFFA